jgi:hypothetical protein
MALLYFKQFHMPDVAKVYIDRAALYSDGLALTLLTSR